MTGIWLLVLSTVSLLKNRKWGSETRRLLWSFNQIFSYQIGFGLTLYLGVSPILKTAISQPEVIQTDSFMRFWTVIHGPSMLMAFGVFQIGRLCANKNKIDHGKFKILTIALFFTMGLIMLAPLARSKDFRTAVIETISF